MFLIVLRYVKPLAEIDALLGAHRQFLERHYADGSFLLSGRRQPRTGGVILARAPDQETLRAIIAQDPFFQAEAAQYDIIEFVPTMAAAGLDHLTEPA